MEKKLDVVDVLVVGDEHGPYPLFLIEIVDGLAIFGEFLESLLLERLHGRLGVGIHAKVSHIECQCHLLCLHLQSPHEEDEK